MLHSFCTRCRIALILAVAAIAALSVPAQAPSAPASSAAHVDDILSHINRGRMIGQAAVSPDGKRLAWGMGGEILVAPIDNLSAGQRVTASSTSGHRCVESDFAWSPDSTMLVFASDCAESGGQLDLYLSHLDGNSPRRLTALNGDVAAPAFSPDGKQVAFLYVEGATRPVGALAAMNAPSGVIGEDHIDVQRVAAVSLAALQPSTGKFVTPADLHVYEFAWSPDSRSLAYIAADPPGENNWWVAKLFKQELSAPGHDSGSSGSRSSKPEVILDPVTVSGPLHGLQIAVPRWSPDGRSIAFIGGLMSDQGVIGGDVWIVSSGGGEPHDLTPRRPSSSQWIAWGDDRHLYSAEVAGGNSRLVRLDLSGEHTSQNVAASFSEPLFSIDGSVGSLHDDHSLSPTADRSLFVFVASSFSHPPEIYAVGSAAPQAADASGQFPGLAQLTHFNAAVKPSGGPVKSIEWTNESLHIQGWLQLPADYDPSQQYPLIVEVHGGPAASIESHWDMGFPFNPTVFSSLGYFVLQPNPRGSYGQGEAFTQANRKDFGYGDLRDILAGVDTVLAHYSVDPDRIGIDGWSYGGFMTMFAVTQTHRFRAAVAGAGISDWLSYYGENSIDQWMIPYFGASVYDDPQVYAKSSAIDFIKNVTIPTLTVVGDRDGECPAPQSFEFWHALRDLHVPAELVVYPNEGHGLADPAHRRDVLVRTVDWFARYMPPSPK
jgi:dipeptidyl aminopeptidase/acylaminoacyl peptidase